MSAPAPKISKKKEPAIKFPAAIGGMKTLASGAIVFTLSADPKYTVKVMNLLNIKNHGDTIILTAVRVKATPKVKENASKKQDSQKKKIKRRARRYPYRD